MTPERVRELTGWPVDVPEDLIQAHLDQASRELAARLPGASAAGADYQDALAWLAAASTAPLLHTFAMAGAAKVGRLEGTLEWRFLAPNEAAAYAAHCRAMAEACIERLEHAIGIQAAEAIFVAAI